MSLDNAPLPDEARDTDSDADTQQIKEAFETAWAEWELIQKKIDSVSAFPFQVKAWSVTLSAGLLAFLSRSPALPPHALWGVLLLPVAFRAVESSAESLKESLGRRARVLERVLEELRPARDLLPASFPDKLRREVGRFPGLALFLVRENLKTQQRRVSYQTPVGEHPPDWALRTHRLAWRKHVVPHADLVFFWLEILALFSIILVIEMQGNLPNRLDSKASSPAFMETNKNAASSPETK